MRRISSASASATASTRCRYDLSKARITFRKLTPTLSAADFPPVRLDGEESQNLAASWSPAEPATMHEPERGCPPPPRLPTLTD
jgi:hypothetical protein